MYERGEFYVWRQGILPFSKPNLPGKDTDAVSFHSEPWWEPIFLLAGQVEFVECDSSTTRPQC